MNLNEEKIIIEQAKKSPDAFAKLYDEYYSRIFGYVLKRVAQVDIAQDITSETFLKALKGLWSFRWKNVSFVFWLYRIASNEIANYFRKQKHSSFENVPEQASDEDVLADAIDAQKEIKRHQDFLKLQKAIKQVSFKEQEVITLRFFEKKKIKEIAKILGKREGTVKSLLHRGLKKLRDKIDCSQ